VALPKSVGWVLESGPVCIDNAALEYDSCNDATEPCVDSLLTAAGAAPETEQLDQLLSLVSSMKLRPSQFSEADRSRAVQRLRRLLCRTFRRDTPVSLLSLDQTDQAVVTIRELKGIRFTKPENISFGLRPEKN